MDYLLIFSAKTIENILSTLRIIFLSNNKKILSAVINSLLAFTWLYSTITLIKNISSKPQSILAYLLGCFIGSYIGSVIENTLALGDNMITCIANKDSELTSKLRNKGYVVTEIDGYGINNKEKILLIMIPRKKKYKLVKLIKSIDNKTAIIWNSITHYTSK